MKPRKIIASVVAAAALSTAIAGPVLAGPPTVSGPVTCTMGGTTYDMGMFTGTRKELAAERHYWSSVFCDKGSFDISGVTRVPG